MRASWTRSGMSARAIPTTRSDFCCRGRGPYLERFIHGGLYEARPDIHGVVHNHSPSVIPFGITERKLKPLLHMCANIGHEVPTWDSHDKFGDTALLVESVDMGRDLARAIGS